LGMWGGGRGGAQPISKYLPDLIIFRSQPTYLQIPD
jgi:hypothetical protein